MEVGWDDQAAARPGANESEIIPAQPGPREGAIGVNVGDAASPILAAAARTKAGNAKKT